MGGEQPVENAGNLAAQQLGAKGGYVPPEDTSAPVKGLADPPAPSAFAPGHPLEETRKDKQVDKIAKAGGEDKVHGTSGSKVVAAAEPHLKEAAELERKKVLEAHPEVASNRAGTDLN